MVKGVPIVDAYVDPSSAAKWSPPVSAKRSNFLESGLPARLEIEPSCSSGSTRPTVELVDFYEKQLAACDKQIEAHLRRFEDKSGTGVTGFAQAEVPTR